LTEHRDKLELLAKTLLDKEVMNHQELRDLLGDRPKGKHADGLFSEAKIVDEVVSDESTPETKKSVAENSETDESTTSDESISEMIDNASKDHSEVSDEDVKEEGKEPKKDLFS